MQQLYTKHLSCIVYFMLKQDDYFIFNSNTQNFIVPFCCDSNRLKYDYLDEEFHLSCNLYWLSYHGRRRDGEEIDLHCIKISTIIPKLEMLSYKAINSSYELYNHDLDLLCLTIINTKNLIYSLLEKYQDKLIKDLTDQSLANKIVTYERISGYQKYNKIYSQLVNYMKKYENNENLHLDQLKDEHIELITC